MPGDARPAKLFEPALEYSAVGLLAAIFFVGGRCLPRILLGRATIVEREVVQRVLAFLSSTAPASALTTLVYGVAVACGVFTYTSGPDAFGALVLPELGGIFLRYVIPFAVANLVILKGVVGLTSDIASMRVSQEVDAVEAVGLHPAEMIFAPRALALIVTAPALAVIGVYAACLGGWLVSWIGTNTGLAEYVAVFVSSVSARAVLLVVVKLVITALTMSVIAGYFGFLSNRAGQGFVGRITTSSATMAVLAAAVVNVLLIVLSTAFHLE
jgi:phospholipid/cholesterol/gamma-HCH transport system permease protein